MSQPVDKRPLVMIGIPCGDRVHKEFAQSLWGLARGSVNHRQGLVMSSSSIVAHGRNNCITGAIECKADYLMFIDSDMTCPHDTINKLVAYNLDIVGAAYPRRGPPFDNLGHTLNKEDISKDSGLVEMSHIPTGMLLIKMSVFNKMKQPIFRFEVDEEHGRLRGEDFCFSEAARALGFRLWIDLDITKTIGHMYQYPLNAVDAATRAAFANAKDQEERTPELVAREALEREAASAA